MFFQFDGDMEMPRMPGSVDPDEFEHWARWSGTSFAAPVVTAAVVRQMVLTGADAEQAVAEVVDAPALFRIPGLGTVVNLAPNDLDCEPCRRALGTPAGGEQEAVDEVPDVADGGGDEPEAGEKDATTTGS
jgi:hypothetical protein